MTSALLIRLYPAGPWRYGPGEGGQDRTDALYRSDRLFSAVTLAFERLGMLEEWLDATARAETPAVVFGSLFPFQGETLFVHPPATLWPPPAAAIRVSSPVFTTKIRWRAARFVPVSLVETLLMGQRMLADQWIADAESGCLLRRDRPQTSPFRTVIRTGVAVDRLGSGIAPHRQACIEFENGSGLWTVARFSDEAALDRWEEPVRAAFRLLADSGLGGRRSSGWGQVASMDVHRGSWPAVLLPKLSRSRNGGNRTPETGENSEHWLLSVFAPAATDQVKWGEGCYSLIARGGVTESRAGYGSPKRVLRMVEEGSVLATVEEPRGAAVDVAPEGFSHPVYRAGFALSIRLPAVQFAPATDETVVAAPPELDQALTEALKAAAEEGQASVAPEEIAPVEATGAEAEPAGTEPEGAATESGLDESNTQTTQELDVKKPEEKWQPAETGSEERHGLHENAPENPLEEAPSTPITQQPERVNMAQETAAPQPEKSKIEPTSGTLPDNDIKAVDPETQPDNTPLEERGELRNTGPETMFEGEACVPEIVNEPEGSNVNPPAEGQRDPREQRSLESEPHNNEV